MAFKIFEWLIPKNGKAGTREVTCSELIEATTDYSIRKLAFNTCVNMIANAVGRCEFRTFENDKETHNNEYWTWNYEPNMNQNSTMFLHKLVDNLYRENETLVIDVKKRDGSEMLYVADEWEIDDTSLTTAWKYKSVRVGDVSFNKTFKESEVLHLRLNNEGVKPVIDAMYASYCNLISAAIKHYQWEHGQHWKVHVDQMAAGQDEWEKKFGEMITEQVKPFFDSNGAVLPEFDGYTYTDVGGKGAGNTRDIKELILDIFDFTAQGIGIPSVLIKGTVESTSDAMGRFMTNCVDPVCDQLQEEIMRKRYGVDMWKKGNYLQIDTSTVAHFNLFAEAASIEKLVGSGTFTINDIRRAAGQPTINEPWANQFYLTKNIATMNSVANAL